MREEAAELAAHIEQDLPEFTIHDITHLDALWPLAATIAPGLELTPTEAYLYGAAVLLHDLGLALAAYPGGREALHEEPAWGDQLSVELRRSLGRAATKAEVSAVTEEVRVAAERSLLRKRHADRAGQLGTTSWRAEDKSQDRFLIADDGLRAAFGDLAGKIAASHWRSPSDLPALLPKTVGAPTGFPAEWRMRPLLLACLLRLADAAHLDAGRAPPGLRAGRPLGPEAAAHWDFQARMLQVTLDGDRLLFASASPFPAAEAKAWWLCRDVLRVVDEELRAVDSLLSDTETTRFAARSVAGIEAPSRLAKLIRTDGWEPVDARVGVSDVARLVERVGGEQLYGAWGYSPLRELIQNAADAVRAREGLQDGYSGRVLVRLIEEGGRKGIEVEDDGLGMAAEVLVGSLLDFGRSLWESPELPEIVPGLAGSGFQATGRFGIGFFSIFIWAHEIDVVSRPFRAAEEDTHVLSFQNGLGSRPLLRRANASERLAAGGTLVRMWWKPELQDGLGRGESLGGLGRICRFLAPALPVDLWVEVEGERERIVAADDWLTVSGADLLERVAEERRGEPGEMGEAGESLGAMLRLINDADDVPVARAALLGAYVGPISVQLGAMVDGGLRVRRLPRTAGIWKANSLNTARDRGTTQVTTIQLAPWASEQAELFAAAYADPENQQDQARAVAALGGDPGPLVVCKTSIGWLDLAGVSSWAKDLSEVRIIDLAVEIEELMEFVGLPRDHTTRLEPGVVDVSGYFNEHEIQQIANDARHERGWARTLEDLIREAIADGWDLPSQEALEEERCDGDLDLLATANQEPLYPSYIKLRPPRG